MVLPIDIIRQTVPATIPTIPTVLTPTVPIATNQPPPELYTPPTTIAGQVLARITPSPTTIRTPSLPTPIIQPSISAPLTDIGRIRYLKSLRPDITSAYSVGRTGIISPSQKNALDIGLSEYATYPLYKKTRELSDYLWGKAIGWGGIASKPSGIAGDIATRFQTLGRGIVKGASSIPEMGGQLLLGSELAIRQPKKFTKAVPLGLGVMAGGIVKSATEDPLEFTGQIVGQALVFKGLGKVSPKIDIGEVKVPIEERVEIPGKVILTPREVPIWKGAYVEFLGKARPLIGTIPKEVETIPQEIAIGFKPKIPQIRGIEPVFGFPKAEKIPVIKPIEGYQPRTALETSLIAKPEVVSKFGIDPLELEKYSVGKQIIQLTSKQQTAFQVTKPITLSIFGREITLPIKKPTFLLETATLPPEGVKTILRYIKEKQFKFPDTPSKTEERALGGIIRKEKVRAAEIEKLRNYVEAQKQKAKKLRVEYKLPESLFKKLSPSITQSELERLSKPIFKRVGIDSSKVKFKLVPPSKIKGTEPYGYGVQGTTIFKQQGKDWKYTILVRNDINSRQIFQTTAHEVGHVAAQMANPTKTTTLSYINEPTAIRVSHQFINKFVDYYGLTEEYRSSLLKDIGQRETLSPYWFGEFTSRIPYQPSIIPEFKAPYPSKVQPLIEKVMGSFPVQSQIMPEFRRLAGDIDIHTFGTKQEAFELAKGLQLKLKEKGIESRVVGTSIETFSKEKGWKHAVQFLPKAEVSSSGIGREGMFYGMSYNLPTTKIKGIPTATLGEQISRKIASSLMWYEGKLQPPTHRFIKDITDPYRIGMSQIKSKSLKFGIPILKEQKVAKGYELLKRWQELYPEINWGKELQKPSEIKVEIPFSAKTPSKSIIPEIDEISGYSRDIAKSSYKYGVLKPTVSSLISSLTPSKPISPADYSFLEYDYPLPTKSYKGAVPLSRGYKLSIYKPTKDIFGIAPTYPVSKKQPSKPDTTAPYFTPAKPPAKLPLPTTPPYSPPAKPPYIPPYKPPTKTPPYTSLTKPPYTYTDIFDETTEKTYIIPKRKQDEYQRTKKTAAKKLSVGWKEKNPIPTWKEIFG